MIAWLALVSSVLSPTLVEAPPPAEFSLDWRAPPRCPTRTQIEAMVEKLVLGRIDGAGTLDVVGIVTEVDDGGYRLQLSTTVGERAGTRELVATSCDELAQSVALVVAVALVPSLQPEPTRQPEAPQPTIPEPEPEAETETETDGVSEPEIAGTPEPRGSSMPEVLVAPEPPARSTPEPASGRSIPAPQIWLRAGLGVDAGGNPSPTLASRVAVGVAWPHLRLGLEGTHLAPQRESGEQGASGLVQQGVVGMVGCGVLVRGPWSMPLCAGLEVGVLRADSRGLSPRTTATGLLVSPLARGGLARRWKRIGLWFDAEVLVAATTTRVVLADEEIFRPNPVWFRALVGIEIAWGGKTHPAGQEGR